jgi:hypothetical protein
MTIALNMALPLVASGRTSRPVDFLSPGKRGMRPRAQCAKSFHRGGDAVKHFGGRGYENGRRLPSGRLL